MYQLVKVFSFKVFPIYGISCTTYMYACTNEQNGSITGDSTTRLSERRLDSNTNSKCPQVILQIPKWRKVLNCESHATLLWRLREYYGAYTLKLKSYTHHVTHPRRTWGRRRRRSSSNVRIWQRCPTHSRTIVGVRWSDSPILLYARLAVVYLIGKHCRRT